MPLLHGLADRIEKVFSFSAWQLDGKMLPKYVMSVLNQVLKKGAPLLEISRCD